MAEHSKIEWCDSTFNPWIGCTQVSPGCDHCYAKEWDRRFAVSGHAMRWGPAAPRTRTSESNWRQPVRWNAQADAFEAAHGRRRRVFCASLADVFDIEAPEAWRAELFALIGMTPRLDWLLLTKRIGNVPKLLERPGMPKDGLPANVWLGATVVNQEEADRDIPKLIATPARVRFLSIEPMLGEIDLTCDGLVCTPCTWCSDRSADPDTGAVEHCRKCEWTGKGDEWAVDWVICGGESGKLARPMHPEWVRSLRDQCAAARVPFLFKQWGEWLPGHQYGGEHKALDPDPEQSRFACAQWDGHEWDIGRPLSFETYDEHALYRVGKRAAGRLLDGVEHNGVPR